MNPTPTSFIANKVNKQFTSSINFFDLLEAYYPEKHHTIVRMRNATCREFIETGTIKEDDSIDEKFAIPYRKLLNTCISVNWFPCPSNKILMLCKY